MAAKLLQRRTLGTQLAWVMAAVVTAATLLLTGVLTSMMQAQMERDKGVTLASLGRSVTLALGKNLRDRMQQVELLTDNPDLWRAGLEAGAVGRALEQIKKTRPFPSWVGVADPSGKVVVSTDGLLVGQDVSQRPWFAGGLRGPYVGDVHQAKLLASLLPPPSNGEPLRFVDFAAPVRKDGHVAAVVGLHGDVRGLQSMVATLLPNNAVARHLEVYILTRSGEVVYGDDLRAVAPLAELESAAPEPSAPNEAEQARPAIDVAWADGRRYLTTRWSLDEYTPGWSLGWQVLVRQPTDIAYEPAARAARRALGTGLLLALVAVAIGWLLGRQLTLSLRRMAVAARDVEQGKPDATIPIVKQSRELAQLSGALHSMTHRLESLVEQRTQELQRANVELRTLGEEQAAMLDNELVGIVRLSTQSRIALWHNRGLARIFGYEMQELAGQPARLLYGDDDTYEKVGQEARSAFERGENYIAKVQMVRKDGSPIWIHLQGKESRGEAIWMMTDVTSQHLYQEQVEHIAFHDPLTGLANRLLLADRVNQAIKSAAATGDMVAVAYMDLDGFNAVNDRLGHDAGDQLLKVIASRATACVRAGDTVARLGGDEFVIVLASLGDRLQCEHVLSRLLNEVARPVGIREAVEASVSGSIGVALYPTNGTQGTELLSAADAAMYVAKRGGKGAIMYASSAETPPPTPS